jgi:hypothetical protein
MDDRFFSQTRICFTLIAQDELPRHSVTFGEFAIGLNVDVARRLGAFPVFYINRPTAAHHDEDFGEAGISLLNRLFELECILVDMAGLRNLAENSSGRWLRLSDRKGWMGKPLGAAKKVDGYTTVHTRSLLSLFEHLTQGREAIDEYIGAIRTIFNLFYWTGSQANQIGNEARDELKYWREREWRVIGGLSVSLGRNARQVTPAEANVLQDLNRPYFGERVTIDGIGRPLTELCLVVAEVDGKPIRDVIEDIIVPVGATDQAKMIAARWGLQSRVHPI